MEPATSTAINLSCVACRITFQDNELFVKHYKTDWHRYNLKARVVNLSPRSKEEFEEIAAKMTQANEIKEPDHPKYCDSCKKRFGTASSYDNHVNSKRHKDRVKRSNSISKISSSESKEVKEEIKIDESIEKDSDIEEVDSDEWDEDSNNPIDNNNCIFCLHHSRNFIKNLKHMTIAHSFFIPDVEYCTDMEGLLRYLGDKVSQEFVCLWCNEKGRTFHSAEAARGHMIDKGHCRMIHEGLALAEYADYYDYSSSYPDANDVDVDKNEEIEVPELDDSEFQMTLPSGAVIGHRSLMKYYRQNLRPGSAVVIKKDSQKLHKVLATYKSLGWTATQQEAAAKHARDLHAMKRLHAKLSMKLAVKANKLQKHYRQQSNY